MSRKLIETDAKNWKGMSINSNLTLSATIYNGPNTKTNGQNEDIIGNITGI